MRYELNIFASIFRPSRNLYQLRKAEILVGLRKKLILIYLLYIVISAISAYIGIGTESYSGMITQMTIEEFETGKLLLIAGKVVFSILFTTFFILFFALLYWLFLHITYKKAVMLQTIVFAIHILEKAITSIVLVLFDLHPISNPLSFGVISQHFIEQQFWSHFFGAITLFHFLAIALLYYYLKNLTDRKKHYTLAIILLCYIMFWFITAATSYIDFQVFF